MDVFITLTINGVERQLDVDPTTPLLWVIRENVGLTGTKFGCGIAQCGACTVHLDGAPIRSCVTPVQVADIIQPGRRYGHRFTPKLPHRQGRTRRRAVSAGIFM